MNHARTRSKTKYQKRSKLNKPRPKYRSRSSGQYYSGFRDKKVNTSRISRNSIRSSKYSDTKSAKSIKSLNILKKKLSKDRNLSRS